MFDNIKFYVDRNCRFLRPMSKIGRIFYVKLSNIGRIFILQGYIFQKDYYVTIGQSLALHSTPRVDKRCSHEELVCRLRDNRQHSTLQEVLFRQNLTGPSHLLTTPPVSLVASAQKRVLDEGPVFLIGLLLSLYNCPNNLHSKQSCVCIAIYLYIIFDAKLIRCTLRFLLVNKQLIIAVHTSYYFFCQ